MDYQNRVGNKQGGGGLASSQETNAARRARVRELLSSSSDFIENDPYVFRNHLGLLECRLCLTTHVSESSFLIHIQGKKHQTNLKRRQYRVERGGQQGQQGQQGQLLQQGISSVVKKNYAKIGTPAYKIQKIRHPLTEQLGLLVTVQYPKIAVGVKKPLYRFMNYYEQKVDTIKDDDENGIQNISKFQYLILSAEPYENICIKIPNKPVVRCLGGADETSSTGLWDYWDVDIKTYYLQLFFRGL